MKIERIIYGLEGLLGNLVQAPECPSCQSKSANTVDRKYFHQLRQCSKCSLLFRFPRETSEKMERFYQKHYQQAGLTTDLPDDDTLAKLVQSNFAGTTKDFTRFIRLFEALGVYEGAKLLDFGANWGYGMYQFQKVGFSVSGYEISAPRAAFGKRLGVSIATEWSDIESAAPFDMAFSAHVLEHTPDPAEAIRRQISVIAPGGFLVAVFPHGSPRYRDKDFAGFHQLWGRVHPVLPTIEFLDHVLTKKSWFVGTLTEDDLSKIADWDGDTFTVGDTSQSELLVVYKV